MGKKGARPLATLSRPKNRGHGNILYKEEADPIEAELRDEDPVNLAKIRDVSYLDDDSKAPVVQARKKLKSAKEPAPSANKSDDEEPSESAYQKLVSSLGFTNTKMKQILRQKQLEEKGKEEEALEESSVSPAITRREERITDNENNNSNEKRKHNNDNNNNSRKKEGRTKPRNKKPLEAHADTEKDLVASTRAEKTKLQKKQRQQEQEEEGSEASEQVEEGEEPVLPADNQVDSDAEEGEEGEEVGEGEAEADAEEAEMMNNIQEGSLSAAGVEDEREGDPYKTHFDALIEEHQIESRTSQKFPHQSSVTLGNHPGAPSFNIFSNLPALPPAYNTLNDYKVKEKLATQWFSIAKKNKNKKKEDPCIFTPLQSTLFPILNNYHDLLFCHQTFGNAKELRQLYLLHALNHIMKGRDRVLKNTAKLNSTDPKLRHTLLLKDQGFTRPRVLILLPFRNSALEVIKTLVKLSPQQEEVANRKRFLEQYGPQEDEEDDPRRPEDYKKLFGGNIDDCFRMGISFAGRKQIKLYSEFYKSDIIVASPLGLRIAIGAPGEKNHDYDFLSSIELVILDQTDVFLMQNWDHILHIFQFLNTIARKPHDTDFSRVRDWYLNGWAKYYRQTLIFSAFITPEINALFNRSCMNIIPGAGKHKIRKISEKGTIMQVVPKIRQMFHRLKCQKIEEVADYRFNYFVNDVMGSLRESTQQHTVIFIPSYFDYVRIRNWFTKEELNFAPVCEYTDHSEVARARTFFSDGRRDFLLYTERFHFFHRYNIRGIHNIIFYALPQYPQFYPEMLNLMEGTDTNCTVLLSAFDRFELERVVGHSRADRMLSSDKFTFLFC